MKTESRLARYRKGLQAETVAVVYLRLKGYQILARRFKTTVGEIDIVARRGRVLAFIEVKRRGAVDDALLSVTGRAQARIARAAHIYMGQYKNINGMDCRFDIIAVMPRLRIRHFCNAWEGRS